MPRDLSFERAMGFAAELIRIPSLPGQEGAVAARIVDELRALGVDEVRTDRAGNVIGRIAGRGPLRHALLAHGGGRRWRRLRLGARPLRGGHGRRLLGGITPGYNSKDETWTITLFVGKTFTTRL